jgi:ribosomal-protein-alanine N-acetyltransferase
LVTPFLPDSCIPKNIEEAKRDLDYLDGLFDKKESIFWVIADRYTNEYIGNIGFSEWDQHHNRAEIAYEIRTKYWNRGFATATIRTAVSFAFEFMKVARVQATTVTHNHRSVKVLQKNNFVIEGVLNHYKFHKGQFVDIVMLGQSYPMFEAAKKAQSLARQSSIQEREHYHQNQKQKQRGILFHS